MDEKEIRRELRKVRHRETELLTRNRFVKGFGLDSVLNKYIPDSLEKTLHSAFREAFRLIFDKGSGVIVKTFNEDKVRASGGTEAEAQKQWMTDILLTSVEGAGLGLIGVGVPDIAVFTGMLLRSVYQTAASYQFEYASKTEQVFILKLIEGALTRGKEAEKLSAEVDELMHRIDTEDYHYYGNINKQIEDAARALSEETLYLKFVQTIPIVGIAGGLSNPIYLNKVKNYADVKYHKRRLLIRQREAAAARNKRAQEKKQLQVSVYEPEEDAEMHKEDPSVYTETEKGLD